LSATSGHLELRRRPAVRAAIFNEPRNITAGDRPDAAIKSLVRVGSL